MFARRVVSSCREKILIRDLDGRVVPAWSRYIVPGIVSNLDLSEVGKGNYREALGIRLL